LNPFIFRKLKRHFGAKLRFSIFTNIDTYEVLKIAKHRKCEISGIQAKWPQNSLTTIGKVQKFRVEGRL